VTDDENAITTLIRSVVKKRLSISSTASRRTIHATKKFVGVGVWPSFADVAVNVSWP
jgi:hypothetical protein